MADLRADNDRDRGPLDDLADNLTGRAAGSYAPDDVADAQGPLDQEKSPLKGPLDENADLPPLEATERYLEESEREDRDHHEADGAE